MDQLNPYNPYYQRNSHYVPQPYYYYPYHPYPATYPPNYYRQYPEVNPSQFMTSAQHMRTLMKDAVTLLDHMSDSKQYSLDLMSAAQQSNQQKVNMMIKETGIKTPPKVTYTPDGLKLQFQAPGDATDCCNLTITLRWS